MRELVNTLVTVVDRRDPYSAHHSTRTAEVARAIAAEIGLDDILVETTDIAASLMNLGKILVPEEFLTAKRKLTKEERMLIRNSTLTSADLLEGIDFGGPVAQTLGQNAGIRRRQRRAQWYLRRQYYQDGANLRRLQHFRRFDQPAFLS